MNNLIITIIGIALTAIAAVMGVFYGGTAFENAQVSAIANSIINDSQNILLAARLWSVNNGQTDLSGMGVGGGTGMSMLVNSGTLAEWTVPLAGHVCSQSLTNCGAPQPNTSDVRSGNFDSGCFNFSNNDIGRFYRNLFTYQGGNYITYVFGPNTPYDNISCFDENGVFASDSMPVKIAQAINSALNQVPKDATFYSAYGLPGVPSGSTQLTEAQWDASGFLVQYGIYLNPAGQIQTNYCYFFSIEIWCTFGPT